MVEQGYRLIEKKNHNDIVYCYIVHVQMTTKHSGSNKPTAPSLFLGASTAPPSQAISAICFKKRRNNH